MYIPQEDHMHAIDFHILTHDQNYKSGHRVVVQSLRVTEAVMKMFSHNNNSTPQSEKIYNPLLPKENVSPSTAMLSLDLV